MKKNIEINDEFFFKEKIWKRNADEYSFSFSSRWDDFIDKMMADHIIENDDNTRTIKIITMDKIKDYFENEPTEAKRGRKGYIKKFD
jgi:hypothetical protein